MHSTIELTDLKLPLDLGTYAPGEVLPEDHLLDLSLTIDPRLVLVDQDSMAAIFDYDPLIAQIDHLAREGHYETQERLITKLVSLCAEHAPIQAVTLCLRKRPVLHGSGTLGVRLELDSASLEQLRGARNSDSSARGEVAQGASAVPAS